MQWHRQTEDRFAKERQMIAKLGSAPESPEFITVAIGSSATSLMGWFGIRIGTELILNVPRIVNFPAIDD